MLNLDFLLKLDLYLIRKTQNKNINMKKNKHLSNNYKII